MKIRAHKGYVPTGNLRFDLVADVDNDTVKAITTASERLVYVATITRECLIALGRAVTTVPSHVRITFGRVQVVVELTIAAALAERAEVTALVTDTFARESAPPPQPTRT